MPVLLFFTAMVLSLMRYIMWSDIRERMEILEEKCESQEKDIDLLLHYVSDEMRDRIKNLRQK